MLKHAFFLSPLKASSSQNNGIAKYGQKHKSDKRYHFSSSTAKGIAFSANTALFSLIFALNLTGCSIEQEPTEDHQIEFTDTSLKNENAITPTEKFIAACNKCVLGDISTLPQIIKTYLSTYTASIDYPKNAFTYQYIEPHQAFERCALKAMKEGDSSGYDNLIVRPARIARISRYFYSIDKPTQGAYWLQRIINTQGESHGLEVAGRVFIQHPKTIGVGVRLLEQSARLGNINAKNMLLGLMNPSSSYYQELTRNTLSDAFDNTEEEEKTNNNKNSNDANDYDDMNNANPDFEDNSEYDEDSVFDDDYNKIGEATASSLKRLPEQRKINANLSDRNRAIAQENIRMLAAKSAEAKATAAKQAAAESSAAQNSPELSPLDALESDDIELNIPMGLYEKRKPILNAPSDISHDSKTNDIESNTTINDNNNNALENNVTKIYRQENQDRMNELESKAEAAAQKVRERMAQRQAQWQNTINQNSIATPNTEQTTAPFTAPANTQDPDFAPNTASEPSAAPEAPPSHALETITPTTTISEPNGEAEQSQTSP